MKPALHKFKSIIQVLYILEGTIHVEHSVTGIPLLCRQEKYSWFTK